MQLPQTPLDYDVFVVLRAFLLQVLPSGVEVIKAQVNRAAEPKGQDFVVMTERDKTRLETNIDNMVDCLCVGSISGNVLTITQVSYGTLAAGSPVYGTGVLLNTYITGTLGGTGGTGTYLVNNPQTILSGTIGAGVNQAMQPTEILIQLDVHGPNSSDNAQVITTLFRDNYAVDFFEANGGAAVPLYADDAKQLPFMNENQQIETRYVIEAHLQSNPVVTVGQQFASAVQIGLINVDASYPPS